MLFLQGCYLDFRLGNRVVAVPVLHVEDATTASITLSMRPRLDRQRSLSSDFGRSSHFPGSSRPVTACTLEVAVSQPVTLLPACVELQLSSGAWTVLDHDAVPFAVVAWSVLACERE